MITLREIDLGVINPYYHHNRAATNHHDHSVCDHCVCDHCVCDQSVCLFAFQVVVLEELYVFPAWLVHKVEKLFRAVKVDLEHHLLSHHSLLQAFHNPSMQHEPWGGIQVCALLTHYISPNALLSPKVIANGDPMQSTKPWNKEDSVWEGFDGIDFVHQLARFNELFDIIIGLETIYRTSDDRYKRFLHRAGQDQKS